MEDKKICRICEIEKLESEFAVSEFKRKTSTCKMCVKNYNNEYFIKNKEKIKLTPKKIYDKKNELKIYCKTCNYTKSIDLFSDCQLKMKSSICKNCISEKNKNNYDKNPEAQRERAKTNYIFNKENDPDFKEKTKQNTKKSYIKHKPKRLAGQKKYAEKNKTKIRKNKREYNRKRKEKDPSFKLRGLISKHINQVLKENRSSKNGSSSWEHLPYNQEELRIYIEALFSVLENLTPDGKVWMSWNNHGKYNPKTWKDNDPSTWVWNLDHIIPHSEFRYTNMKCQEFLDCWALSNLRPYSAKQNIIDGTNRTRHSKKDKK